MNERLNGAGAVEVGFDAFGLTAPPWFLRWKLTWVQSDIDELERLLAEEFGVSETAPLHAEYVALIEARDALMRRLTTRTGAVVEA